MVGDEEIAEETAVDDVELRLIDPARNRFRVYGVTTCRTLFGEVSLFIAWGRLGRPLRTRTEAFKDAHALEARRAELLRRRARRGYAMAFAPADADARTRAPRPKALHPRQLGLPFL